MSKDIEYEVGSGNVFADLELPNAKERLAKAEITFRICEIIHARKLTQKAAAKILDIHQPDVSALMNGQLDRFSEGRLFRFLNKFDKHVEIVITDKPQHSEEPGIAVIIKGALA